MNGLERVAYMYARVKATMILRKSGVLPGSSGLRSRYLRLPVLLAGMTVLLLGVFAGGSGAGVSNYQGTLYLNGPASSVSGGSWQITTTAGPAQGVAAVAAQGVIGSGGLNAGSYRWIYVTSSGGAFTASASSNQLTVAANTPVLVANVPVGADVYRATIPSSTSTGKYTYVGTNPGPTTTYTDTNTSTAGAALPQADNRVASGATGWAPFTLGTSLGSSLANTSVSGTTPAIPSSCTGWIVDASGGMTFPAGTWTVNAQVRPDASGTGAAVFSAAIWKVDGSGSSVSGGTVVPVTDGGAIALNGTSQTVSVSYTTTSATTLDSNEHLCLQFWRHQTAAYVGGGASTRTAWLLAYDPNNAISVHPAPNAFASAALSSPADGFRTQTIPALNATYSDPEGDSGNLTIRLCSDSGCGTQLETSGAIAANNGETKNWTPTGPLSDGTYYWQARAQDSLGLPSAWTSSRSFVIDNAPPTTTIDSGSPSANSNAPSGNFFFSANESVTGFQCRIDGAAFGSCTSPHAYGPLGDGPHTFDVRAVADLAGNAGTTTNFSWTIDTVPPNTTITSQPSALSNSSSPSFTFTASQSGSTFECELDGGGFSACSSPKTYSGVADGAHTFQVRAVDPAGNADASPDSYAWSIDATPPDTSIGAGAPAALTTSTSASFTFSATEGGSTFQCSLDGAAFSSCSSPRAYSGLADGSHTFQVRATDTASNTDPSPSSHTWTVDTTPPVTSIGPTMPAANTSATSATFDLASNEAGSTFECALDGAAFAPCTTPANYSGLADGSHTFSVRATDQIGNLDASPAGYTWQIDNVAPAIPTLTTPADTVATNSLPQLRAVFNDATAGGDTGTVEFQICSAAASAGSSCAPIVQAVTSASVSSGDTASGTPAALADGTYHWQARGRDAAGNLSAWSATRSFQLDMTAPTPSIDFPKDGATVNTLQLKVTFNEPSFGAMGTVEFRVCSDALCLGVVRTGTSSALVHGQQAIWSPSVRLTDGIWYWQTRAVDTVGNASAWSATRVVHIDTIGPQKPPNFTGEVGSNGLILRWQAPPDNVANYVLYVNGVPFRNLATTETEVNMGSFDANDSRTFSVQAIDTVGNVGTMSPVLVGVPNLLGLAWGEAKAAASARGLELRRKGVSLRGIPVTVTEQDPVVPKLVARGSSVLVTVTAAKGTPLALAASPKRVVCASGSVFRLRVELSAPAQVRNRLLNARGRVVKRGGFGSLNAGTTKVRVKVPRGLKRGSYRLLLDARGENGVARAVVRVKVGSRVCRAR
jgi:hypothetical protein